MAKGTEQNNTILNSEGMRRQEALKVKLRTAKADGNDENEEMRITALKDIARLILTRPEQVKANLRNTGFVVPDETTNEELTRFVSDAIYKSKKFATLLVESIRRTKGYYDYEREENIPASFNTMGPPPPPDYTQKPRTDWAATINLGLGFIRDIFVSKPNGSGGESGYSNQQTTSTDASNDIMTQILLMKSMEKGGGNVGMYIGVGTGVLVIVGLIIFLAVKKS